MKKALSVLLTIMMLTLALAGCGSAGSGSAAGDADYPTKDINGIIMWGEGG